jgi:hypothetical protein
VSTSGPETGFEEIAPRRPFALYLFSTDVLEADLLDRNSFRTGHNADTIVGRRAFSFARYRRLAVEPAEPGAL